MNGNGVDYTKGLMALALLGVGVYIIARPRKARAATPYPATGSLDERYNYAIQYPTSVDRPSMQALIDDLTTAGRTNHAEQVQDIYNQRWG